MVVVTVAKPPGIFGVAAGGFVALLLLIGAVTLACWFIKRASVVQHNDVQTMNNNDTKLSSFREVTSINNNYGIL